MSLNTKLILDRVISHALSLGLFEQVNGFEPKAAPGNGLTCAVWVDRIEPAAIVSGLAASSARLVLSLRIYTNMIGEPIDLIDPNIADAVDKLMTAYSGDFTLDGAIRNVDLLGEIGDGLSAEAGYLEQDRKMFRVMTINLPMIINDAWEQVD